MRRLLGVWVGRGLLGDDQVVVFLAALHQQVLAVEQHIGGCGGICIGYLFLVNH